MTYQPQRFTAPDGTEMVVLTAEEFGRLNRLAEEQGDLLDAEATLARIAAGEGTMPAEVLNALLDEGVTAVAAWRRYRGLSQAALANRAGLSQVFVSKIERGESHGTPKTRRSLASALDAPLWALEDEGLNEESDSADVVRALPKSPLTIGQRILELMSDRRGRTAKDIAQHLFGPGAEQPRVNADCVLLLDQGELIRSGEGGVGDPYVYALR